MRPDWLIDGPEDAHWTLLLAHGAGQGMESGFLRFFADDLARAGVRVVRFEFPYMAAAAREGRKRPPDRAPVLLDSYRSVIARVRDGGICKHRLAIGGKSLGGRIASLIADEQGAEALVCLGYPFHPPGRADQSRTAHLATLALPALICQGTRDPFGKRGEVEGYGLPTSIQLAWIEEGDHGFKPPIRSGRTLEQSLAEAGARVVEFLARLSGGGG